MTAALMPAFEEEMLVDSMAAEAIKIDLSSIDCIDDIVQKWKDIYIKYIEYIQTGEVAEDYRNTLRDYSRECSDIYGDAIHLARTLTNTFDYSNYNIYDSCLDQPVIPREQSNSKLIATIQPNPTKGEILINLDKAIWGKINVFDMSGKLILSRLIEDEHQHSININTGQGVYMLNILSDTGERLIEKIVIIK